MRFAPLRKISFRSGKVMALTILTFSMLATSIHANAFTCEDVRGLSTQQQNYWSKRLHLSSTERHLIWVACYRDYHSPTTELVRR